MKLRSLLTAGNSLVLAAALSFGANSFALEVGDEAPCVVLENLQPEGDSTTQCIRDHEEGQNFTVLEFLSIDCSTCVRNLPNISALAADLADVATVRQVSVDRDVERVKEFLLEKGELINMPVALDFERDAKTEYGIRATPTLMILNSDNIVVYKHRGFLQPEDIEEITELVNQ